MFGFEQIITLSQASIDAHFASLMYLPWMALWENHDFTATYGPLKVRLLSNERALVWVELKHGHVKTSHNGILGYVSGPTAL